MFPDILWLVFIKNELFNDDPFDVVQLQKRWPMTWLLWWSTFRSWHIGKKWRFFIIIIAPSRFILWREKEMIFKNLVGFYSRAMHGVPKSSLESLFLEFFSWHWKFLLKLQILDESKNWNSAKGDLSNRLHFPGWKWPV